MHMAKEDPYKQARRRVKAKREFYRHLTTYLLFSVFFFLLNAFTGMGGPGGVWFIYPILGWGMGLAAHYLNVFGLPGSDMGTEEWEERKIEREMRGLKDGAPEARRELEDDQLELRELERQKRRYSEDDLV